MIRSERRTVLNLKFIPTYVSDDQHPTSGYSKIQLLLFEFIYSFFTINSQLFISIIYKCEKKTNS